MKEYPFKGGGCYLLLGTVEVDYHFSTTISKMEKTPFIPDPRYRETEAESSRTQDKLREDVLMTQRALYPQEQEINLPRHKMFIAKN